MSGGQHPRAVAPAAVVFDCDGTLADTEPMTARVFDRVLARYGYRLTATDVDEIIGRTLEQNHAYLLDLVELPSYEEFDREWYEESYRALEVELELFEDAVTVVLDLAAEGIPIGVASSSPREHVRRILDRAGLTDLVSAVVAHEDVDEHKPDPAPYQRAAALLGVDVTCAVAVEDTSVGIAAARAAGMVTIGVSRSGIDPATLGDADHVVRELTTIDVLWACTMGPRGDSSTR